MVSFRTLPLKKKNSNKREGRVSYIIFLLTYLLRIDIAYIIVT